jgi:hypothetical protein
VETAEEPTPSTVPLTKLSLFQPRLTITREEAFELSYQRARVLNRHYGENEWHGKLSEQGHTDALQRT